MVAEKYEKSMQKGKDKKRVVIVVGGSLLFRDEMEINAEYIKEFAEKLSRFCEEHAYSFFIVCGGGKIARKYINAGRKLKGSESECDELGIKITRVNAELLRIAFKKHAINFIPESIDDVDKSEERVIIMGGTTPGHTTDAVGAALAKHVDAELFIIATNVNGVYDRDPRKYENAKRFEKISAEKLLEIVKLPEHKAGYSSVVDMKAAEIIKESGIRTVIMNGEKVDNILKAIKKDEDIRDIATVVEQRK